MPNVLLKYFSIRRSKCYTVFTYYNYLVNEILQIYIPFYDIDHMIAMMVTLAC